MKFFNFNKPQMLVLNEELVRAVCRKLGILPRQGNAEADHATLAKKQEDTAAVCDYLGAVVRQLWAAKLELKQGSAISIEKRHNAKYAKLDNDWAVREELYKKLETWLTDWMNASGPLTSEKSDEVYAEPVEAAPAVVPEAARVDEMKTDPEIAENAEGRHERVATSEKETDMNSSANDPGSEPVGQTANPDPKEEKTPQVAGENEGEDTGTAQDSGREPEAATEDETKEDIATRYEEQWVVTLSDGRLNEEPLANGDEEPRDDGETHAEQEEMMVEDEDNNSLPPATGTEDHTNSENEENSPKQETGERPDTPAETPLKIPWNYLPLPDDPEKHDEFDCQSYTSPEGLHFVGARARGKKHKHDGTNCDDWYEFEIAGPWTLIAVSDGAGSKKLSRIGARVSCQAAVKYLKEHLQELTIERWSEAANEKLDRVRETLHGAMRKAYAAVMRKVAELINEDAYFEILDGRPPSVRDLSATLLLAVHTSVQYRGEAQSLIISCSVGDGMVAVIGGNSQANLLMEPDSGDFSGEVEFLTEKMIQSEQLEGRTYGGLYGSFRALLMMSDGVSDDYVPHNAGMRRLYGDLVLNRIIDTPDFTTQEMNTALRPLQLHDIEAVLEADYSTRGVLITVDGSEEIRLQSVQAFAEQLGVSLADVVASAKLLAAGRWQDLLAEPPELTAEERMCRWLDAYYVRGSFDDRTLVTLYRKDWV